MILNLRKVDGGVAHFRTLDGRVRVTIETSIDYPAFPADQVGKDFQLLISPVVWEPPAPTSAPEYASAEGNPSVSE